MKQILILGLFLVLDFSGRALDASEANNASTVLDKRTVYLVSHGWHAGIVLRREDLFGKRWPIIDNVINLRHNSLFCRKISSIHHHLKESEMNSVPAVPTTDQAVLPKII